MKTPLETRRHTVLVLFMICAVLAVLTMGKYAFELAQKDSLVSGDFPVFWQAAQRVADGRMDQIYSPADLHTSLGDGQTANYAFIYPPVFASLLSLLALVPANAAYLLWLLAVNGFFLLVMHRCYGRYGSALHSTPDGRMLYAMLLLATPILCTALFTAQLSGLLAGLLLLGMHFSDRRPLLAGLAFGLMCIKPQYALLAACAMLARGRWQVIVVAVATAALCAALATLHLGIERWSEWLALVPQFMQAVYYEFPHQFVHLVVSPFYTLSLLMGMPYTASMAIQLVVSVLLLVVTLQVFRATDSQREPLRMAWLLCASLLASPHMFSYDLLLALLPVMVLLNRAWSNTGTLLLTGVLAVGVAMSPFMQALVSPSHFPFSLMVSTVLVACIYQIYRKERSQ
ncbi:MAG: glycosyltransferase 87 family protein [Alphaproteobacteria bacterium]